jgi:Competence protein
MLGMRKGAIVAGIGIIFYTLPVGADPAVSRAAFLGIHTMLGHQQDRIQDGINSLAFAAAALAIISANIL